MPKTDNPYQSLPSKAFWKPSVSAVNPFDVTGLWDPKFPIGRGSKIATFGSCFAQHFGRELRERGFNWMNTEPAPFGLSPESQRLFNYNTFSCRTGNIYTASLLRQWLELSLESKPAPGEIWLEENGRVRDPLRPAIEPDGFASETELMASRKEVLAAFHEVVTTANIFVFTLGLTESWINSASKLEYQMCPGTAGGTFDPAAHTFVNQDFSMILQNLKFVIGRISAVNPTIKFLLTVSPVPLTATMSGNHVLVATMASKSILRAVCAQLSGSLPQVDYFPSYEIINSPAFKGMFYEPNMRSVHQSGVDFVMKTFFGSLAQKYKIKTEGRKTPVHRLPSSEELVCEEQLLAAFAGAH